MKPNLLLGWPTTIRAKKRHWSTFINHVLPEDLLVSSKKKKLKSNYWMFYQIFFSPQVKRWAIITYKHGIYKSCITSCRKTQNFIKLQPSAQSSRQNENFVNISITLLKNRNLSTVRTWKPAPVPKHRGWLPTETSPPPNSHETRPPHT